MRRWTIWLAGTALACALLLGCRGETDKEGINRDKDRPPQPDAKK